MANPEYPDQPDPNATVRDLPTGLAIAQSQGLPLATGQPNRQTLPLAPVQLQQPPVGFMEGLGRALEGFGSGMRGQMAPWEQIQLAQQERALKQRQLDQQAQQIQGQLAMNAVEMFTKLSSHLQTMPDEQRDQYAAMFAPMMVSAHQQVTNGPNGIPAAPLDVAKAEELLKTPGATQEWLKTQQDALPQDLVAARNMKVADANTFLVKRREDRIKMMLPTLQQAIGSYVEQVKTTTPGQSVTVPQIEQGIQQFLETVPDAQIQQRFGISKSMAQDAVTQWLADPKSKTFLNERGVVSGGKKPSDLGMTESLAGYVQQQPLFKKAGITIGDFETLPPESRATILEGAKRQMQADVEQQASMTGYAAAMASARAKRDEPLIQSAPNLFPIDVKNEQPVDRVTQSFDSVQKMGGEKAVKFLDAKQYDAFTAAKELEGIIGEFVQIGKNLTTKPGANFGQMLSYYAQTKFGKDNPGVAFDALQGASLRVARAMQGSSQALSNIDLKSIGGMLPSPADTAQTALHRLEVAASIVQNMKNVQLGKSTTTGLLSQIKSAHDELNATMNEQATAQLRLGERMIQNEQGVTKVVPAAGALPPGWKEVGRGRGR